MSSFGFSTSDHPRNQPQLKRVRGRAILSIWDLKVEKCPFIGQNSVKEKLWIFCFVCHFLFQTMGNPPGWVRTPKSARNYSSLQNSGGKISNSDSRFNSFQPIGLKITRNMNEGVLRPTISHMSRLDFTIRNESKYSKNQDFLKSLWRCEERSDWLQFCTIRPSIQNLHR